MNRRQSRVLSKFGFLLDPFLVLGIFFLFLVPVLTLVNLTPAHRSPQTMPNVLGLGESTVVSITPNTETKDGIYVDKMTQGGDNNYTLYAQHVAHKKGSYKNEIFRVDNGTEQRKSVVAIPNIETVAEGTKISLVVRDVKFVLLDEEGTTYTPNIYVDAGDSVKVSLLIESPVSVNFNTGLSLGLVVE